MQYRALGLLVAGAVVATLGLAACGDDGGNDVDVTLSEFIVEPDPQGIDNGEVTFKVENAGGETHEFVVVKAASADDVPTDADGAVDEDQIPDDDAIGEIEDIESHQSKEAKFDLEPGRYLLFCNIVEETDGETESHFAEGMHATLTVE
jgi:uncharacterized cupredoxin-like copper-binding protein